MAVATPEERLETFVAAYSPDLAALGRAVLRQMRALLPGMLELVYDNFQWLVVGFSATERPSDASFSIVFQPHKVSVVFLHGASLADPKGMLSGDGKQVRNLQLRSSKDLLKPDVRALIDQELVRAPTWDRARMRQVIIRAVAARRKPRRLAEPSARTS